MMKETEQSEEMFGITKCMTRSEADLAENTWLPNDSSQMSTSTDWHSTRQQGTD